MSIRNGGRNLEFADLNGVGLKGAKRQGPVSPVVAVRAFETHGSTVIVEDNPDPGVGHPSDDFFATVSTALVHRFPATEGCPAP